MPDVDTRSSLGIIKDRMQPSPPSLEWARHAVGDARCRHEVVAKKNKRSDAALATLARCLSNAQCGIASRGCPLGIMQHVRCRTAVHSGCVAWVRSEPARFRSVPAIGHNYVGHDYIGHDYIVTLPVAIPSPHFLLPCAFITRAKMCRDIC